MIQLNHYSKAIVAIIGIVALNVAGIEYESVNPVYNQVAQFIIGAATVYGVYQAPNQKKRKR